MLPKKSKLTMKWTQIIVALSVIMVLALISGCSDEARSGEHGDKEGQGEHSRESEGGEHGSSGEHGSEGEDEASGDVLSLTETYDTARKGARLILIYDAERNAFKGTVENTTNETLKHVRVEVHLSNGTELGPTPLVDLAPSEKSDVTLKATAEAFDGWTRHAEVGRGEHGPNEGDG